MNCWICLTVMFFILLATACGDRLDFGVLNCVGVVELMDVRNCRAPCGQVAECEGETIKVQGRLKVDPTLQSSLRFQIEDLGEPRIIMEVEVDSLKSEKVFDKLEGMTGASVMVTGEINGYNLVTNYACDRVLNLRIAHPRQVEF